MKNRVNYKWKKNSIWSIIVVVIVLCYLSYFVYERSLYAKDIGGYYKKQNNIASETALEYYYSDKKDTLGYGPVSLTHINISAQQYLRYSNKNSLYQFMRKSMDMDTHYRYRFVVKLDKSFHFLKDTFEKFKDLDVVVVEKEKENEDIMEIDKIIIR